MPNSQVLNIPKHGSIYNVHKKWNSILHQKYRPISILSNCPPWNSTTEPPRFIKPYKEHNNRCKINKKYIKIKNCIRNHCKKYYLCLALFYRYLMLFEVYGPIGRCNGGALSVMSTGNHAYVANFRNKHLSYLCVAMAIELELIA